jgi:lysophospholipase L1-like esterase
MKEKNKINEPLKIIGLTIVFALMLSLLPKDIEVFGVKLKHVDIIADLRISNENQNTEKEPDSGYKEYLKEYQQLLKESADSTSSDSSKQESFLNSNRTENYAGFFFFRKSSFGRGPKTKYQKIIGNLSQMKKFYRALNRTGKEVVRIAHFGDSGIEGDLISQDIREELQKKFGGRGPGWLSITRKDITFRISTKQSFSDNWEMYSLYTNNPHNYELGISGEIFIPKGSAWAQFEATRFYRHSFPYKLARIFYSNSDGKPIKYQFGNRQKGEIKPKRRKGIQQEIVTAKRGVKKFRIDVPTGTKTLFYGVSLENGNGIYLDNFPLRGNSGVDIKQIHAHVLKDFARYLNYKLILLEFGLNALPMIKRNYDWYVREMVTVVNHLKKAFPRAAILIIGVQDKSIRKGGKFVTDPLIFRLLKAQMEITKKTNVAFWNLFEAMGGINSMHQWVTNNPPLASQDHVHFNLQGGKKVAHLLVEALLNEK